MEQLVKVCRVNEDGTALVSRERISACSGDCHQCSGCGAAGETVTLTAENPIGARAGDLVVIHSRSGPLLAGAMILYLCPLILFFAAYGIGQKFWHQGEWLGAAGFFLGILLAAVYDRRVAGKRKTVYTITGYGTGKVSSLRKEDKYLD